MRDFSQPYLEAKRLLEQYYNAAITQDRKDLILIANALVEQCLKLEDIAHD